MTELVVYDPDQEEPPEDLTNHPMVVFEGEHPIRFFNFSSAELVLDSDWRDMNARLNVDTLHGLDDLFGVHAVRSHGNTFSWDGFKVEDPTGVYDSLDDWMAAMFHHFKKTGRFPY